MTTRERIEAKNVEFRFGEIEHFPVADLSVDAINLRRRATARPQWSSKSGSSVSTASTSAAIAA